MSEPIIDVKFWFMTDRHTFIPLLSDERPIFPTVSSIVLAANEANIMSGGYGMLCPATVYSPSAPKGRKVGEPIHFGEATRPIPDATDWMRPVVNDVEIGLFLQSLRVSEELAAIMIGEYLMKDFL